MSRTSNQKKADFLGMPHGTANHRLRKSIIFHLLERLGETGCFKCGLPMTVETISIEHKKPWLYVSPDLFWDLENITFSHVGCNLPDRSSVVGGSGSRILPPKGMNWCNRHKKFLPSESFGKNRNHWTGVHTLCKECQHYNRKSKQREVA